MFDDPAYFMMWLIYATDQEIESAYGEWIHGELDLLNQYESPLINECKRRDIKFADNSRSILETSLKQRYNR